MTATHVNGLAVIAVEPTPSPLNRPDKPVYFTHILTLSLEDGTQAHGCALCDFTADAVGQVRAHLRVHPNRATTSRRTAAVPADMSIADLLKEAQKVPRLIQQRDEWKRRALRAERALADIARRAAAS